MKEKPAQGKTDAFRTSVNFEKYADNYQSIFQGVSMKKQTLQEIANHGAAIGMPWLAIEEDGSIMLFENQPHIRKINDTENIICWCSLRGEYFELKIKASDFKGMALVRGEEV